MFIHITRHGQVYNQHDGLVDGVDFPYGENPLTDLGRRQAAWLGQRLRDMGFGGRVYSSPYRRAMDTAAGVARKTGGRVTPVPAMREIVARSQGMERYRGLTTEEYLRDYDDVCVDGVALPPRWWSLEAESEEDVERRAGVFVEEAIALGEDCLLVGHGGSVGGATHHILHKYGLVCHNLPHDWNCCLTTFEIQGGDCRPLRIHDMAHIPVHLVTANNVYMVRKQR